MDEATRLVLFVTLFTLCGGAVGALSAFGLLCCVHRVHPQGRKHVREARQRIEERENPEEVQIAVTNPLTAAEEEEDDDDEEPDTPSSSATERSPPSPAFTANTLREMKCSELRLLAVERGASAEAVEEAMEHATSPKAGLIELLHGLLPGED